MELADQIRKAYERDKASGRQAVKADDIPISYEAITPQWLTAVLCYEIAGAKVIQYRLGEPDNGTNNRRRIFLEYNDIGREAGLPESVFCKATHDLRNRLILGHSGAVLGEVIFYTKARNLLDIQAPRAWFASYDPESFNSIIILDDLSEDVTFCSHEIPLAPPLAESQIRLLAKLHGRFLNAPELKSTFAQLPSWRQRFANLEGFHLEDCCKAGFLAAKEVIPDRLFRRQSDIWPATLETVRRHDHLPQTLCHGDVHLKNWYITSDGQMGLTDWGVIHKGHWARDLAYTIATALEISDRRKWDQDLIRYYLELMREVGAEPGSFEDAWKHYRQGLFSSLALWTLTLAPMEDMPDMQPQDTSLTFIKRIAHAIDDTDALDTLS